MYVYNLGLGSCHTTPAGHFWAKFSSSVGAEEGDNILWTDTTADFGEAALACSSLWCSGGNETERAGMFEAAADETK